MRFGILGPLRVSEGAHDLAIGPPQQQLLLALLLTTPDGAVSVDRIIDEIWGDEPPVSARNMVHIYVSQLRALLGDAAPIRHEDAGYALSVESDQVDALRLEQAVRMAAGVAHDDPAAAERLLDEAIALWRGQPFGELADMSKLLQVESARLEHQYLDALSDLTDLRLDTGHDADLTARLEELTRLHPYRERFWEQLMLALYRAGRQADALRAAGQLRTVLGRELGIEPSPALQELEDQILLHDPGLQWEAPAPPNTLPQPLTTFIGRREETAEVAKLLDVSRLVTLTGAGGIGKTRLAIEVAASVALRFPDGVWWVDLAVLDDEEDPAAEVARSLGVGPAPGEALIELITRALLRRDALLVIDNCEHVSGSVARLAEATLTGTQGVRILATSRVPLRVAGEALWIVPPLSLPTGAGAGLSELELADAVRLFLLRAGDLEPSFRITEENAASIVEIVRRLDGIPLAIEMAASRVRVLAPAQIASALDDRFDLLSGGSGTVERHRTLRAAIDWSYGLLPHELQDVFDRMSVFAGDFDLEAAEAVTSTALEMRDAVARLIDASMVTAAPERGGVKRYRLLETLRSYGAEHLRASGDEAGARRAHATYFLDFVASRDSKVGTPAFSSTVEQVASVYQDVQKALDWSLQHGGEAALRAAPTLLRYWYRRADAPEAKRWGERMLQAAGGATPRGGAAAHLAVSFASTIGGDPSLSASHAEEAIRILRSTGDRAGLEWALFGRAQAALQVGDLATVEALATEGLEVCDELENRWAAAGHLTSLSFARLFGGGDLDEARRLALAARRLYRELGDLAGQVVMNPLSVIALRQGDIESAERFAVDSAGVAVGTGWEATALVNLAEVRTAQGALGRAERTLIRAARRAVDTGLENWFRIALRDLGRVDAELGRLDEAAILFGASRRNMPFFGQIAAIYEAIEERCRTMLTETRFAELADEGYDLTHDELLGRLAQGAP